MLRRSTIVLPWGLRKAKPCTGAIVIPQAMRRNGRGDAFAEQRRSHFEASIAGCSFASFDWFASLETGLKACWRQQLSGDVIPLFGPRAGMVAAAIRHVVDPEAGTRMPPGPRHVQESPRPARPEARAMMRKVAAALNTVVLFGRLEWQDRRAGRQLELVHDRLDRIGPRDILLVTCLRNECARMPAFVEHSRALGVRR